MSYVISDMPTRATWNGFGKPIRFKWLGDGSEPNQVCAHYIGRVEEDGDQLRLYDLNNIERAEISRRKLFWAVALPF